MPPQTNLINQPPLVVAPPYTPTTQSPYMKPYPHAHTPAHRPNGTSIGNIRNPPVFNPNLQQQIAALQYSGGILSPTSPAALSPSVIPATVYSPPPQTRYRHPITQANVPLTSPMRPSTHSQSPAHQSPLHSPTHMTLRPSHVTIALDKRTTVHHANQQPSR